MENRKRAILKAVVHEFTASAVPVGSQVLAQRHFVNLSSATIRHELSHLSDLGYLIQPHTSAGRIPSDQGYRYFVDFLMDTEPLPKATQEFIDEQITTAPPDIQAIVERVAMVVANVTQNASVVTAPYGPTARIKHIDLVSLDPHTILLILLLEGNLLRQQLLEVEGEVVQAELGRLAQDLQADLVGQDRESVAARIERRQGRQDAGRPAGKEGDVRKDAESAVLDRIHELLDQFEKGAETLVVHDGVRNLVRQPEFSDSIRLQEVLEVLEQSRHLSALLRDMIGETDLQVVIGSENLHQQLRGCTLVLTTYGPTGRLKGTLGVVGPTRLAYGQTVARLGAVARAATSRIQELAG